MFKVNKKDTRITPNVVLVSLLLTYLTPCPSVSIVNFEQIYVGWQKMLLCQSSHPRLISLWQIKHEKSK